MIDLPAELAHEHERSLRRQAEASHVAALARSCHATVRHAATLGDTAALRATRTWLLHGQLGPGYVLPRDDRSSWNIMR